MAFLCGPAFLWESRSVYWLRAAYHLEPAPPWFEPSGLPEAFRNLVRGVVFGVPAMAALVDRLSRGRRTWVWVRWAGVGAVAERRRYRPAWIWTEWAGLSFAVLVAVYWLADVVLIAFEATLPYARLNALVRVGWLDPALRPNAETAAWATVHGLSLLLLDGPYSALTEDERERIVEATLDMVVRGLAGGPEAG